MRKFVFLPLMAIALSAATNNPEAEPDFADTTLTLSEQISQAYDLAFEDKDKGHKALLALAAEAEGHLADAPEDLPEASRLDMLSLVGEAYFGAAQFYDSEWGSSEDVQDREWLIKAATALEPVLAARGPNDAPAYDFRGATGQLFTHGRYYDLAEWKEWSRLWVLGNRYMLARMPEDELEKRFLAESLYSHGWLTQDKALIAEADAIFDTFPEGDKPSDLQYQRERIAAGKAPYAATGEIFF